jgi:hypothetical protein
VLPFGEFFLRVFASKLEGGSDGGGGGGCVCSLVRDLAAPSCESPMCVCVGGWVCV